MPARRYCFASPVQKIHGTGATATAPLEKGSLPSPSAPARRSHLHGSSLCIRRAASTAPGRGGPQRPQASASSRRIDASPGVARMFSPTIPNLSLSMSPVVTASQITRMSLLRSIRMPGLSASISSLCACAIPGLALVDFARALQFFPANGRARLARSASVRDRLPRGARLCRQHWRLRERGERPRSLHAKTEARRGMHTKSVQPRHVRRSAGSTGARGVS